MSASERASLEAELSRLRRALHDMALSRQMALATGHGAAADQLRESMQRTANAYNAIVARLREIEGPSSSMAMLDRVGDVAITGIVTGATTAIQAVDAAGDVAKGAGTLARVLPFALLAVVAVVGIGLYRGSLKVTA